ncbi:MAG: hypothetical protein J2P21_19765 [Chloracidobacterium sp.]|nr:hypothetical protein [Chloracidobacterium sp.]
MPGIRTNDLLERIDKGAFVAVRLNGIQNGSFCMMLDCGDETFIHENLDGSIKIYSDVEDALSWLKRKTGLKEIVVNVGLWKNDLLKI